MRFENGLLSLTGWDKLIDIIESKRSENMKLEDALLFLRSFRFKFVSINPLTFEIEDLNPQDNVNIAGKLIIDVNAKTISFSLQNSIKW
jgi:hypothetical protein